MKSLSRSIIVMAGMGLMVSSLLFKAANATPTVEPEPGKPNFLTGAYDVGIFGYREDEFFISGDATTYKSAAPLGQDGEWSVYPAETAPYRTRIVVIRPKDPAKFNGTALVEWLNVSGGLDAPAEWFMAHRELVRSGYAYVGVSAQKVGIDGGESLGTDMSLKKMAPARYASLNHPGDAFSFDIFSQAGRIVRAGGKNGVLGPLVPKSVIAAGESQSAHFLTTYIDAIDPLAKVFDGFLVHSRFSGSAPLDGSSIMAGTDPSMPAFVRFRTDLRVPVMAFITETDLVGGARTGYYLARQPETDRLRVWEVPGTAHADTYTISGAPIDTGMISIDKLAAAYAAVDNVMGTKTAKPINFAPQHHYALEAALSSLNTWVRSGNAPRETPRIALTTDDPPHFVADSLGITRGGVRTPWVDVPTAKTSGVGNAPGVMAMLFGSGEYFDCVTLDKLYPGGKSDYLAHFQISLDTSIHAGSILPADREEILALASAMYPLPPAQPLVEQTGATVPAGSTSSEPRSYTTAVTTVGRLLADPAARAIIEKHIPGFATAPGIEMAKGMTLRSIQQMAPDKVSAKSLDDIDADLANLPAPAQSEQPPSL